MSLKTVEVILGEHKKYVMFKEGGKLLDQIKKKFKDVLKPDDEISHLEVQNAKFGFVELDPDFYEDMNEETLNVVLKAPTTIPTEPDSKVPPEPVKTEDLLKPVKPEEPPKSVKSENSPKSVKPEDSPKSAKPEDPLKPVKPEEPPKSVKSENSPKSVKPEDSPKSAKPEDPLKPVKPEEPPKSVKSENSPKSVKPEDSPKSAKPEDPPKSAKLEDPPEPVTSKPVTEEDSKPPICSSAPDIERKGGIFDATDNASLAVVAREKMWKGRQELKVFFMNPDDIETWGWKSKGEPLSVGTVFAWAKTWHFTGYEGTYPFFKWVDLPNLADIRVKFVENGGNWSRVGADAEAVSDLKEPTMQLSLRGFNLELQESLVVHEFGHALGLEHEHQRSDFWDVLEKHIDLEKMKKDPLVTPSQSDKEGAAFGKNWFKNPSLSNRHTEYDPLSIMHYWFDVKWIKDLTLQSYKNTNRDPKLSDKERTYLDGIHKRFKKGQLPKRPSLLDYKALVEAYGGKFSSSHFDSLPKNDMEKNATVLKAKDHLKDVKKLVWDTRARWRHLGTELVIPAGTLDTFHDRDDGINLSSVLETWMYKGKATINQLIVALESEQVGRADLAKGILALRGTDAGKKLGLGE